MNSKEFIPFKFKIGDLVFFEGTDPGENTMCAGIINDAYITNEGCVEYRVNNGFWICTEDELFCSAEEYKLNKLYKTKKDFKNDWDVLYADIEARNNSLADFILRNAHIHTINLDCGEFVIRHNDGVVTKEEVSHIIIIKGNDASYSFGFMEANKGFDIPVSETTRDSIFIINNALEKYIETLSKYETI